MDTTAADLSNRAVFHKSRQTPNTARTVRSGTHPSFLNKSYTVRQTAKQGVFGSQYRFLLLSLAIGERNHDLQIPLKTGFCSQIATNIQHRANNPVGTHPSLLNKSHTGQHTAKQGANLTVHIKSPKYSSSSSSMSSS